MMNAQERQAKLAALPEFSRAVYAQLQAGLYAEPGFTDVSAEDLARKLKVPVQAINASIGHLEAAGLVFSVDMETYLGLDTVEHTPERF